MTWLTRLRRATFRGVAFGVRESDRSGGRRAGIHVYPLRDKPFVEDLGRVEKRWNVDGYIVGPNYHVDRDRLIAKLEGPSAGFPKKPAGILVHPTFGSQNVLCTRFSVRESTAEGGMARFSMEFVEAGPELSPREGIQAVAKADAAAAALDSQAGADYLEDVQTAGVVEEVRDAIADVVLELGQRLERLDVFSGPAADVRRLNDRVTSFINRASQIATAPADFVAEVQGALGDVLTAAGNFESALFAYQSLFDFEPTQATGVGAQTVQANENARLAVDTILAAAAGGATRAAARISFESLEAAEAERATISTAIDSSTTTASDQAGFALGALREALSDAVPPPGEELPRIQTITPAKNRPALVLAYELYEDPERDVEIIARNAIKFPLLVPGGSDVKVLTQ